MIFCSPFDRALAENGPPAVFQLNRDGEWRFEPEWTRDVWERSPGPHRKGTVFVVLRDSDTAFLSLLMVTSPDLLTSHPRGEVRTYADFESARSARETIGPPYREIQC